MHRTFKVKVEILVQLELEPGECPKQALMRAKLRALNLIAKGEGGEVEASQLKVQPAQVHSCMG